METIRSYIETMFSTWPSSEATLRVKTQMLELMEDKYQELIGEGKSSNEAIGQVLSEFGNIEELKRELAIEPDVRDADMPEPTGDVDREKQRRLWSGLLEDNYWIAVTIVYFIASFGTGWWHLSWLIFLLAVVLESTIRRLLDLPEEDDGE